MLSLVPLALVIWRLGTVQAITGGDDVGSVPGYLAHIEWHVVREALPAEYRVVCSFGLGP